MSLIQSSPPNHVLAPTLLSALDSGTFGGIWKKNCEFRPASCPWPRVPFPPPPPIVGRNASSVVHHSSTPLATMSPGRTSVRIAVVPAGSDHRRRSHCGRSWGGTVGPLATPPSSRIRLHAPNLGICSTHAGQIGWPTALLGREKTSSQCGTVSRAFCWTVPASLAS